MSDIYLSLTETPTVVTLSQPVISGALSSTVTVANTVTVALDANSLSALEQVTVTVGAAVSVSNFPASQVVSVSNFPASSSVTIGGFSTSSLPPSTVTVANTVTINGTVTANTLSEVYDPVKDIYLKNSSLYYYDTGGGENRQVQDVADGNGGPLPISGTVTVGNSVTIGSLPASTVTVSSLPAIAGTVTARLQDGLGNNLTSTSIGGLQRLNVSLASAATAGGTLPSFINIHGGTDGSVARTMLLDSSGRTVVTVSNFPATQPVSLTSTTVTVSSLPSGALTTRFGSVTTANTAQITSAVTNTSRKYLLAQNISAGTVTIGIGFSPTTTQGIQLTAGAGLTFDAFCPTGAVYWLGAVTGAAFTILEN